MVVRRALVSVSDKTGLVLLARGLRSLGVELVSTGGTARALRDAKIPVTDVSAVTGVPEMLDGRVKTLHPRILGGVLALRGRREHMAALREHDIPAFDLVVVNLYPFERQAHGARAALEGAMDLIDIGGPTLIRAAAKNHADVTVIVDPGDYDVVLEELAPKRSVSDATRRRLAIKAFAHTARYDAFVAHYLQAQVEGERFPAYLVLPLSKRLALRYGENHHQEAALYDDPLHLLGAEPGATTYRQLHGKTLSYNNLLDADAALEALKEFEDPSVVIVKHVTPSGVASAPTLEKAWRDAYATDTYSPFGGVVACNRTVTAPLARELSKVFLELVLAPAFGDLARGILAAKKNLRLLEIPGLESAKAKDAYTLTSITGGLLLQDRDVKPFDTSTWQAVTKKRPTARQLATMLFAAKCVKHVKSNAVVFAKGSRTVGIGGGQTARVDAVWIAKHKGKATLSGSVMASEAFFPFRDAVDVAAKAGVVAVVQPGGSIRDEEVIRAANEHGMAMVFTGHRSFRH